MTCTSELAITKMYKPTFKNVFNNTCGRMKVNSLRFQMKRILAIHI